MEVDYSELQKRDASPVRRDNTERLYLITNGINLIFVKTNENTYDVHSVSNCWREWYDTDDITRIPQEHKKSLDSLIAFLLNPDLQPIPRKRKIKAHTTV